MFGKLKFYGHRTIDKTNFEKIKNKFEKYVLIILQNKKFSDKIYA